MDIHKNYKIDCLYLEHGKDLYKYDSTEECNLWDVHIGSIAGLESTKHISLPEITLKWQIQEIHDSNNRMDYIELCFRQLPLVLVYFA